MARRILIVLLVWLGLLPQAPVSAASCHSPDAIECCCATGCACEEAPAERPQPPAPVPPSKTDFVFLSLPPAIHTVRLPARCAFHDIGRFPDVNAASAPARPACVRFCSFLL